MKLSAVVVVLEELGFDRGDVGIRQVVANDDLNLLGADPFPKGQAAMTVEHCAFRQSGAVGEGHDGDAFRLAAAQRFLQSFVVGLRLLAVEVRLQRERLQILDLPPREGCFPIGGVGLRIATNLPVSFLHCAISFRL